MWRIRGMLVLVFLTGLTATAGAQQEARAGELTLTSDTVRVFDGRSVAAEAGRLWVPETRGRADDRLIHLAFVRLPSTAARPGDPVVFLMGGPGIPGSVMARVPVYFDLFQKLRTIGDVILLDQRGTGLTEPLLTCAPPAGGLPTDFFTSHAAMLREYVRRLDACAQEWRTKGVDVAAYNSAASADDVDDLRRALGADRINLLGFSYGTELALAVVRRHADHVARVVLAGTEGPDEVLDLPSTFDRAFRTVALLAAEDSVAPDLLGDFGRAIDRLARTPAKLTVTDRPSQRPTTVSVGPDGFRAVVELLLASDRMPALVTSVGRGEDTILTRVTEWAYNALGGETTLMARAVTCASGASGPRRAHARAEAEWTLFRDPVSNLALDPAYCAVLGSVQLGDDFRRPIWSAVPALFITGELDANTPPFNAATVSFGFPNSAHLVVRYGGHETLPIPAVQDVVRDFFAGQDVRGRMLAAGRPRYLTVAEAKARPCGPRGC